MAVSLGYVKQVKVLGLTPLEINRVTSIPKFIEKLDIPPKDLERLLGTNPPAALEKKWEGRARTVLNEMKQ